MKMKIKVTQFGAGERSVVSAALEMYASSVLGSFPELKDKYENIGQSIQHGELLLCEYVYPEQEKGGQHA